VTSFAQNAEVHTHQAPLSPHCLPDEMQATSGDDRLLPAWKQSVAETVDDVLRWPYRWWCACEANQEWDPGNPEILIDGQTRSGVPGTATLPIGPKERAIPRYTTSKEEMPEGKPQRQGSLLHLLGGDRLEEVTLSVHRSGFTIAPRGENATGSGAFTEADAPSGPVIARTWSPFSIIDRTHLAGPHRGPASLWAPFKLTVVRAEGDSIYYFVSTGRDALAEREEWVAEIAKAIRQVTTSLFPSYAMDVRPLPGVQSTATRIMAGYLLRCEAADVVSLLYGELHAYFGGEALLALYKDAWCDQKVMGLRLTGRMDVHSCTGVDCSIFALEGHCFGARSQEERALWLRAVGNIKVKLMFDAPDPTSQELQAFRAAVMERIVELQITTVPSSDESKTDAGGMDPLLPRKPRLAPQSPRGDIWHLDPMDDQSEMCSNMPSPPQSRIASRKVTPPPLDDEECVQLRLAQVVELMEVSECRQLLEPFSEGDENGAQTVNSEVAVEMSPDRSSVRTTPRSVVDAAVPTEFSALSGTVETREVTDGDDFMGSDVEIAPELDSKHLGVRASYTPSNDVVLASSEHHFREGVDHDRSAV